VDWVAVAQHNNVVASTIDEPMGTMKGMIFFTI
jgi:hypothetical protein